MRQNYKIFLDYGVMNNCASAYLNDNAGRVREVRAAYRFPDGREKRHKSAVMCR